MLVTLNGVRQLLVVSATRMMGVVPGDGKVLWGIPVPNLQRHQCGAASGDRRQPRIRIGKLRRARP